MASQRLDQTRLRRILEAANQRSKRRGSVVTSLSEILVEDADGDFATHLRTGPASPVAAAASAQAVSNAVDTVNPIRISTAVDEQQLVQDSSA
jgi:hypothetical protein